MSRSRPARLTTPGEYIDEPADARELESSLDHVAAVNRWLGGTRALLRALAPLIPTSGRITLLDAGTGSGDVPRALAAWVTRRGLRIAITLLDRHPQILAIASRRTRPFRGFAAVRGDVLALPFPDRAFDFALLSLTLHHLDDADLATALRELARVSRRAVIVNELERAWPNLLGAAILARTIWRRNRLTRHDAPVSVRRGFTAEELLGLARASGLENARVQRRFFFRLVLVCGP